MAGPGEAPARAVGGRAAGSILLLSRKSGVTSGYASKIGSHASGPGGSFAAASIISPRVGLGSLPSERDLLNPGPASSRSWLRRSGAAPSSAACVPAAPLLATWHLRAASLLPRSHHHPPRFYRCARPSGVFFEDPPHRRAPGASRRYAGPAARKSSFLGGKIEKEGSSLSDRRNPHLFGDRHRLTSA